MQTITSDLIEAVNQERIKRKLSHRAFSFFLGIDPSYWHRLRNGERALTLNILTLFVQKIPEIAPEVQAFIMSQGKDGDKE